MKEPLVRAIKEPLIMIPLLFAVPFGIIVLFLSPAGALFELDYLQFVNYRMTGSSARPFFLGLSIWLIGLAIAKLVWKEIGMKGPLVRAVKEPLIMVPLLFAVSFGVLMSFSRNGAMFDPYSLTSTVSAMIPGPARLFFFGLTVWLIGLAIAKLVAKNRKPLPVAAD